MRSLDRFKFERQFLAQGHTIIAGVDEAGRGPLAGPVTAAAAVFHPRLVKDGLPSELRGLNDSKQLSSTQREKFYEFLIQSCDVSFYVNSLEAEVIDSINILAATHRAMRATVAALRPAPTHILVDGRPVPGFNQPSTAIIKGDSLSYSIAAASVLAKVTRDRIMTEHDSQYPGYGFAEHYGYGTSKHLEAIARLGPCPIHRRSFAPFRNTQLELL